MKLKDFKNEIKVLDIAALVNKAKALKIEINDLVLDKNINKIKDLKSISKKRKELARILTVMNQKKMIERLEVSKVPELPKVSKGSADAKAMDKEGANKK